MESKPLEIRRLKLDKWKFEGEFPSDVVDVPGRIWFVKKTIRQLTYVDTQTDELKDAKLPNGFRIWHGPDVTNKARADALQEIEALFERETAEPTLEAFDQRKERGQYFIFASTDTSKHTRSLDALADLASVAPSLADYVACYLDEVAAIYRLSLSDIKEKARLILLRYDIGYGFWQHIDNIAWTDGGPVCSTSLGPEDTVYDMTPTLTEEALEPLRIRFRSSDIAVMDGSSRLEWSHGLPSGGKGPQKYSILFKFDRIKSRVVGHSKILQTAVHETVF